MTQLGLLFDVPLLLLTLYLIIKYREQIANFFLKLPLPNFLVYLISAIPFIIFEENINCGAFQCKYTLLPFTLTPLLIFIAVLGLIVKWRKAHNMKLIILIFSIFGILVELFYGAAHVEFQALPLFWFIFIAIWVGISYAYLVIIPLTILLKK